MKKIICILMVFLLAALHVNAAETTPSYTDVKESYWYYHYVIWADGWMNGFPDGSFRPNENLTREQIAMILYKWEGHGEKYDSYHFKDVKADSWYADAVEWMYRNGFTAGISETKFGVGNYITRQDLVVMIFNVNYEMWHNHYVKYEWAKEIPNKFKDKDEISDYAIPAFYLACNWIAIDDTYMHVYTNLPPILNGDNNSLLRPKDLCTRAEAAVILSRAKSIY